MNTAFCLVAGLALALGACTTKDEQVNAPDPQDQFALLGHSATTIEATMMGGGDRVHLFATEVEAGVVDITWDFGTTQVALHVDKNRGEGQIIPNGDPLDQAQLRLVAMLVTNLQGMVGGDEPERTTVENLVIRAGNLMMIVPTGEELAPYEFAHETGGLNTTISPTCQYQHIGNGYYRTAGKGCSCKTSPANGCAGRCGQGCGGTSFPPCVGSTLYSKDCALHDYQLGSFANASDDYLFMSNNASCGGSCY